MNEYRRFISYIYAYPGNVKDNNVGFIKVEVRNGQCRLDMNLNGITMDASKLYGVYMLVRDEESSKEQNDKQIKEQKESVSHGSTLIPLGEILVNEGKGKYRDLLNPDNMNNSGYGLSDGIGIAVIESDDTYYRMFSLWNDDAFYPEYVHKLIKSEEKNADENFNVKLNENVEDNIAVESQENEYDQAEDNSYNADNMLKESEENETNQIKDRFVQNIHVVQDESNQEVQENITYSQNKEEQSQDVQAEEYQKSSDIPEIQAASAPIADVVRKENALQWLIEHGDIIDAFDDDNLYDCIEVIPEQLKKAVANPQAFDDNSFMMHGFFRFHHLLLGRVQENGNNTQYFIGIPGMYCNRERYMASVFGFGNFKKSHRADYNNPYFGYWYQEI